MTEKQQKKLLKLARSAVNTFDAIGHLGWDQQRKRYYCRGHCEVGTCPGVEIDKLLKQIGE